MERGFSLVRKEQLVQITEMAIDCLVRTYKNNPYFFYTENDLHCCLHNEIYCRLPVSEWLCVTKDDKRSVLLHKEYPTKEKYDATVPKHTAKGKRGHFDLCIWNPETTRERLFRATSTNLEDEQQTFIAIELDLIEENESLKQASHHVKWDLLKLGSSKNEVEHGYALIFARDWMHTEEFLKKIKPSLAREEMSAVLFVEKTSDNVYAKTMSQKQFLNYDLLVK
jgi:cellobiose-specific phosphotransferase system component IIA